MEISRNEKDLIFDLTVKHFLRKEFSEAHELAKELVRYKYPNEKKSIRMAIHIALEAENYEAAGQYCIQLLKVNPEDAFTRKILYLLENSEDKSTIKMNFRSS